MFIKLKQCCQLIGLRSERLSELTVTLIYSLTFNKCSLVEMTLNEKTIFQITIYKDGHGHGLKTKVKKCLRPAFFLMAAAESNSLVS